DTPESERALELACRLSSNRAASLMAVAVIEIPPLLPLDAHMRDEEDAARALLDRAGASADAYGVRFTGKVVRARTAADAIVDLARCEGAELIVLGADRQAVPSTGAQSFGATVRQVLEEAP